MRFSCLYYRILARLARIVRRVRLYFWRFLHVDHELSLRDASLSLSLSLGISLEKRLHAYRSDLLDSELRSYFPNAPSFLFVSGIRCRLVVARAYMRREPSAASPIESEVFYGNAFRCFEDRGGWSWVQCELDGYVGYVRSLFLVSVEGRACGIDFGLANAIICAPQSLCYREPRATAESFMTLAMGSVICVEDFLCEDDFLRTQLLCARGNKETAYVSARHVLGMDRLRDRCSDYVSTAESFMHAPYLYGGCSYAGIDCSALLQVSLRLHGIECPRDADMQEREIGDCLYSSAKNTGRDTGLEGDGIDTVLNDLRRGDFIFWHRHVGIMRDGENFLHANAHDMCVRSELLSEARLRIRAIEGEIRTIRRVRFAV